MDLFSVGAPLAVRVARVDEWPQGVTGQALFGVEDDDGKLWTDDIDKPYRYALMRTWSDQGRTLNVIGLNPSTATAIENDMTIGRCMRFAKRWGFARLLMTNLYAYRSTKPAGLRHVADPVGPANDRMLRAAAEQSEMILAAWGGSFQGSEARVQHVWEQVLNTSDIRERIHALAVTKHGTPGHPLYIAGETVPFRWSGPEVQGE